MGLVQHRWHPDPDEHRAALAEGVAHGRRRGRDARVPAGADALAVLRDHARRPGRRRRRARGAARRADARASRRELAREHGVHVHASLYERADGDGRPGLQHRDRASRPTARWSARTRKLHIPVTAGYYEDKYFRPGPPARTRFPVVELGDARFGFPTCWDQWFPELARAYSLAGAEVHRLPDRDRLGARPPRLRHRAAVGAGDRRQRDRQRHVHGRGQPHRDRGRR